MTDPIADMLIRIKNAAAVKKPAVALPYSKIKWEISRILKDAAYLSSAERKGRKNKKLLELELTYLADGSARIHGAKRISRPSRRLYRRAREIRAVKEGKGLAVVSTSRGLMTGSDARKSRLGGEIICEVW
ncbi:30S ribosomal protein S8 [Candidatus Giovannonibacteria bacterium]|nr:30S ribosomal protein S8 [Candidatus Giovannonibacteria bacterium]